MPVLKRKSTTWLIRALSASIVAFASMMSVTGQAFAHDDDEVVTYGPNACTVVADLPVPNSATCVKHKSELDDGVTEIKNSYVANGPGVTADGIRQAFELTFKQKGWTVVKAEQDLEDQQWEYTVVKPGRRVKIEVEPQELDEGTGTEISIEEG